MAQGPSSVNHKGSSKPENVTSERPLSHAYTINFIMRSQVLITRVSSLYMLNSEQKNWEKINYIYIKSNVYTAVCLYVCKPVRPLCMGAKE